MATQQQQQQGGAVGAKRKPVFTKVDQLKPGTTGHTLTVKVLKSDTVVNKGHAATPVRARSTRIAECLIGDETGTIIFTARNDQGSILSLSSFFPDSIRLSSSLLFSSAFIGDVAFGFISYARLDLSFAHSYNLCS